MAEREKLRTDLELMKAKFMQLDSDEARKAFRDDMEAFVYTHNPEEKKVLSELFVEGVDEACLRTERLYDDVLRQYLEDIYEAVSWSYIARHYFGKSRSWLCQRVNGFKIHDKAVELTKVEKKILLNALMDLSGRIKNTAQVIEYL